MSKTKNEVMTMPVFQMPAVFTQTKTIEIIPRISTPYVHIAQPKSAEFWNRILSKYPGSAEGEAFIFFPNEDILKLGTMKYSLLNAKQFFVKALASGEVDSVSFESKPDWKERIIAAILVYHKDELIPATCEFRSTKCTAIHQMVKKLNEADTPEWLERGPEYKLTEVCPQPFMRFYGTTKIGNKVSRKADGNAYPYAFLTVDIKPTSITEWQLIAKSFELPEFKKSLNEVAEQWQKDCAQYEAKVKK